MDVSLLSQAPLFQGVPPKELESLLSCLGASVRRYRRGERVLRAGEAVGAACLRRIGGGACEMKRLYVREGYRRLRLGEALARAVIERAKGLGYREMLLDTLEDMYAARRLYARLGFRECGPYYQNPIPGTAYMRLELDK